MKSVGLGTTRLEVTRLGLGMAALGRPGYLNLGHGDDLEGRRSIDALREHAHGVLDTGHDLGVRYLDVARSYGRAEDFLAAWLADRPQAATGTTVGSKWGYTYTAGWQVDADEHEVKDHSLATLERQLGETSECLGGHLDLYQVHSATLDSGILDDEAVLTRLVELAATGTVVGLTLSGPAQGATLQRALALDVDGVNPFTCVQATWNVLEPSVGDALAAAREAGWGVIVKESVANGRLTERGDDLSVLADLAGQHGVGVDAMAIAAALAQPFVDVVLSGATTVDQLRSNAAALDVELDGDDLGRLAALAEPPEAYWSRRGGLDWT